MQPTLLIASPQMKDPFFERSLVLVWHFDADGAMGVVVNKILDHRLLEIIDLDERASGLDLSTYQDTRVGWGGPVDATSGTVVALADIPDTEGWRLDGGMTVTKSQDALVRMIGERAEILLLLGYAGWGPGQLDDEIHSGGWLATDLDPALIFTVPPSERWEAALLTLGLTPTTVWMQPVDE